MRHKPWMDAVTFLVLAGVLLGCYATTHRGPRTLDPGQISGGASYLRFKNTDADPDDDPGELVGLDGRVGVVKGVDIGYMRTLDITEGVEGDDGIDTHWFDAKFQILNRNNEPDRPTLSLGYGFGKLVNQEDFWVNSLSLSLGTEVERASLFYSFRYETVDDEMKLVPSWAWEEKFEDVRKAHILGLEYAFTHNFRPVLEIGRFYTGDFGEGLNVVTAGVNVYLGGE
ncbi:MAG: hypothetical protein ACE5GH_01585 [Fidelibacterota bacterium]